VLRSRGDIFNVTFNVDTSSELFIEVSWDYFAHLYRWVIFDACAHDIISLTKYLYHFLPMRAEFFLGFYRLMRLQTFMTLANSQLCFLYRH